MRVGLRLIVLLVAVGIFALVVYMGRIEEPKETWSSPDGKYKLVFCSTLTLPKLRTTLPGDGGTRSYHGHIRLFSSAGKLLAQEKVENFDIIDPHWEDGFVYGPGRFIFDLNEAKGK